MGSKEIDMNDTPVKSEHYVLIIDEKTDIILGAMLQCAKINAPFFRYLIEQDGVTREEIKSFMEDVSAKCHALNWCKDPNCKVKKPV